MRPGRGRPGAARLGLALWLGLSVLLVIFGPPVGVIVLFVLGVYLVGPLWVPVSYTVGRRACCGRRRSAASCMRGARSARLGRFRERSAWIARKGRGTARFLPPLLLLWEESEGDGSAGGSPTRWRRGCRDERHRAHGGRSRAVREARRVLAARSLETPAILFLESVRPLSFVGAQGLYFLEPFARTIFDVTEYQRLARLLERRSNLEVLVRAVEDAADARDAEARRKKKARKEGA